MMKNIRWTKTMAGVVFFVSFCSLLAHTAAAACSADSVALVQKSYVAYYGRPADPGGLDYWACRLDAVGGDMNRIIQAFGVSSEFDARFGALSNDQLLDNLYQQMLSRAPDPSGKAFYLAKLLSGEMTLQSIAINILDGIKGGVDAGTFGNKYMVANYFSEQLRSSNKSYGNIEDARLILGSVDGAISSTSSAMLACDALITQLLPAVHSPAAVTVPVSDADGNYTVSWSASTTPGVSYTLEEATNSTFTTGNRPAYTGTWLSVNITGRTLGSTYYYRVKATKAGSAESDYRTGSNGCVVEAPLLDITSYQPHAVGDQWSYVNNNYATMTVTVGSPLMLPNGVVAIPGTAVDSSQPGFTVVYNTIDASGILKHREYMSSIYIPGYGNTTATASYDPPLLSSPANFTLGGTYASTGTVTIVYANVTTVQMAYSASTEMVGFETLSDQTGSKSWSALKVIESITISGTVNGQFMSTTSAATSWLADGVGTVRMYRPNSLSGVMETWELTTTNVEPPPSQM